MPPQISWHGLRRHDSGTPEPRALVSRKGDRELPRLTNHKKWRDPCPCGVISTPPTPPTPPVVSLASRPQNTVVTAM
eukprot:8828110-Pyramimonas_sp.AAC.1